MTSLQAHAAELEVGWAQTFQESMAKLTPKEQSFVLEAITKLQRGLNVNLHRLDGLPWWSFYVNQNALRVIVHQEAGALVCAWVDAHDAAYAWAGRHRPARVRTVLRFVKVVVDDAEKPQDTEEERPPGPLAEVKDKTFRAFEVSAGVAQALRTLPDEDSLLELCERLHPSLGEALLSLAADPDAFPDIVGRYVEAKKGAQVSLVDAVKAPVNAASIWIPPAEQAVVEAALASDSASWRVFLHPTQKRLAVIDTSGPYLVTGGPGTGKTVVALHRARHLAETLDATALRPVLMTTFSRVLAAQLEDGVKMVCRDAPGTAEKIHVCTLVEAARSVLKRANQPHALLVREDVDAAWAEALQHDELQRGRKFYEGEREAVVLAQGIKNEDEYLRASRAGRGERLDRATKKRVWAMLSRFEEALRRRGGDDAGGLARAATALLKSGTIPTPFVAVVCDEVQDASAWELRMLAALATAEGQKQPGRNRLFLVGDGHQRLYEKPVSLRANGIEVRGRSSRLRLNYRTTQGICAAALDVMKGVEADVLDAEDAGDVDGYRSLRAGERPKRHSFKTHDEEADFIAAEIKGTKQRPFLVLARTVKALEAIRDRLRTRGVSVTFLGDAGQMPEGDHVVLATFHRSKGLECPRVILAAMQESPGRFPGGSEEERDLWLRKERMLVYVAMTRARDACAITKVAVDEAHA